MSTPLIQAFFVGRAIAEVLYERAEESFTYALSELGKFDAEQREHLRSFVDEVTERANREAQAATQAQSSSPMGSLEIPSDDLQATIDDLRAEIAEVRSELQRYRSQSNPA
jgi:predicted  nucleic acid-binding Zn-ribbon protein